ncbi:leucine-rich repeat domain-containing protein [Pseudanabaena minima]|uniref:leucine-rich repeat domain-containing protein n=1 Tax=Pseudanabaena minima TaxID=890415 RepID=UPI003DA96834
MAIIAQAEREGWTELDLSGNDLEGLPSAIGRLQSLEKLILGKFDNKERKRKGNRLTAIPQEIFQLTNLKELHIPYNQITAIPDAIANLANLTTLYLSSNQITAIPDSLSNLANLTTLYLSSNQITAIPDSLSNLANLTSLSLNRNQITAIPDSFSNLANLTSLSLYENQITTIPDAIAQLSNLTSLDLSYNQIAAIPDSFSNLANLTSLSLNRNQITAIPDSFSNLANLTSLSLYENQITTIPDAIAQLSNLTTLNLYGNQIKAIPDAIANLANLTELRLYSNQIKAIPDAITQLANLTVLALGRNQIKMIPEAIAQLANLTGLYLHTNQITAIPDAISQLANLTTLNLSRNQITAIPDAISQLANLTSLNLSRNQITAIPDAISQLANLTSLDLSNNPLPIPPEILEDTENPAAIIGYWQKLKQSERKPLNEAKVILIGHGAVGKTSLVRQLIDRNFKPDEIKTEGIDIRAWQIKAREENVKLRVWDFGGQEIMHATHQFFLTERSLYLLVLNARKDEGNNDVEYWLKIIESFGKDAPVLIIANKSDEHPLKLNRRHLQEKYPNIQGFFETSCKTGLGIDELRKAIAQQIAAMDHVFNELPQQWFRLKEQIEQDNRDHISYTEYECICNDQEISDRQERRDLIRLLHLLGIVLNFAEDTRLQDTSVLNPEWVTGGVYRILNDNQLITKHKGMLNWQDLTRILTPKNKGDRNCYQENRDRQFILDMMQKFELCFLLDANSQKPIYLIPELLDEEEPDTGNWDNTLNLEYHYKILFSSVISRFIVKMHHRISKRTYWRTGVILTFPEGNRAYIKADLADAKIFIRIDGNPNTRRSSLAAIRNTFDNIHHSISALEVDECVPLPDNPKVTVPYDHLCDLEREGILSFIPYGTRKSYEVRSLLDGIEERRSRHEKTESRGDTYHFYAETGQVITGNVKPAGNNIGTQNNNL